MALASGAFLLLFVRRDATLHLTQLIPSGSLYFLFVGAVVLLAGGEAGHAVGAERIGFGR